MARSTRRRRHRRGLHRHGSRGRAWPQPARPAELPPHGPLGQLGRSQDPRGAIAAWPPWRGPRDVSEDVAPAAAPPAGPGEGRAGRHSRCSTGAPRGTGRRLPGRPAAPRVTPGPRGRTAWGALGELSPHWAPPPLGANSPFMPLFPSRNGASALACPTVAPQLAHRSTGGDGLSPGRTAPSASLGPVSGRLHGAWGF